MVSAAVQRAVLSPHDAEPGNPVRSIAVEVRLTPEALLACHYTLEGDLARLRVPAPHAGQEPCDQVVLNFRTRIQDRRADWIPTMSRGDGFR